MTIPFFIYKQWTIDSSAPVRVRGVSVVTVLYGITMQDSRTYLHLFGINRATKATNYTDKII